MKILVTGVAGFIGFHVAKALLTLGYEVVGVDNFTPYYELRLKEDRLAYLQKEPNFSFIRADLADREKVFGLMAKHPEIRQIIHLAAQAGVRYSLSDPYSYVHANILAQVTLLEAARSLPDLQHFLFASSSSVYGANKSLPFREKDRVDTPLSVYAATKRAGELLAYSYSHHYRIPQTGLRFFTVYGPWGRPDMAYFSFARAIRDDLPVTLYEGGQLKRDFTFVDDITAQILKLKDLPPDPTEGIRILNIGNSHTEPVAYLVDLLEKGLGKKARRKILPRPAADVPETYADISEIKHLTKIEPKVRLEQGIERFLEWFKIWDDEKSKKNEKS